MTQREAFEKNKVVNDAANDWALKTHPIPELNEQCERWADDLDTIGDIATGALMTLKSKPSVGKGAPNV